jgi:predicted transposase YbfD/YdcC
MEAQEFYRYLRGHWSIENRLHRCLDVVFREDAVLVTKNHVPENLNILPKMTLAIHPFLESKCRNPACINP